MTSVCREIFKAVHEGKWLSIEYKNKDGGVTRYWVSVKTIQPRNKLLIVDGLHLGQLTVCELTIYLDSILSAAIVDGSYCAVNDALVTDIRLNSYKYETLFSNVANLRILNYLSDCHRLDNTPYKTDYALISGVDEDKFDHGTYPLEHEQFSEIVAQFQRRATKKQKNQLQLQQMAMNVLSVPTKYGLYVLAYKRLNLDVRNRVLRTDDEIVLCKEFSIEGVKFSARQFLDAEDYALLDDVTENLEEIKNRITSYHPGKSVVDDMPYLIAIGRDTLLDLDAEYAGIYDLYSGDDKEKITVPIQAFFGDLTKRPRRTKTYPLALLDNRVNIDQLLAINNAIKYPLTYVQGPPGTGKSHTIANTLLTAFFNDRTVLLATYNNHPIDSVCEEMQSIFYRGQQVPFPIVRLGSNEKVEEALDAMRALYEQVKNVTVYEGTLERNRDDKIRRTQQLTELLSRYDEIRDLNERKETIERLLEARGHMTFQFDLQAGQLDEVNRRLAEIGTVTTEDALPLLDHDTEHFLQYLYYTSVRTIKRLGEPKNKELLDIVYATENTRVGRFNQYIAEQDNMEKFLRVFPIVATTCISAHKLGEPEPIFDMVVMDEASQCNTAVSLIPIIRGKNLMLVGDPQQLSPVILLNQADNQVLRKRYGVSEEYDYIDSSIYKTFLACDAVSDEVLLSYHYRCHPRIIEFNNQKYYNGKLRIESKVECDTPLLFVDVPNDAAADARNSAPEEAARIASFIARNPQKKIGVITPFTGQRACINQQLRLRSLGNVTCGTVHAFQGDQQDIILFSLAVTGQTQQRTYNWLKTNRELINVATSRAREQLVVLASRQNIIRLHTTDAVDDIYELMEYVRTNGLSEVTKKPAASRALGIKPYSTETENAFLASLNHALDNVFSGGQRCVVHREVAIAHVFRDNASYNDLFYTGRFDFVVYEGVGRGQMPILAIELDGKEHVENSAVRERDRKKEAICREHGFELIRVENSYARRYYYIKEILSKFFSGR